MPCCVVIGAEATMVYVVATEPSGYQAEYTPPSNLEQAPHNIRHAPAAMRSIFESEANDLFD
jgi:hypothetical protein